MPRSTRTQDVMAPTPAVQVGFWRSAAPPFGKRTRLGGLGGGPRAPVCAAGMCTYRGSYDHPPAAIRRRSHPPQVHDRTPAHRPPQCNAAAAAVPRTQRQARRSAEHTQPANHADQPSTHMQRAHSTQATNTGNNAQASPDGNRTHLNCISRGEHSDSVTAWGQRQCHSVGYMAVTKERERERRRSTRTCIRAHMHTHKRSKRSWV